MNWHDCVIEIGRYKGRKLGEIRRVCPEYFKWLNKFTIQHPDVAGPELCDSMAIAHMEDPSFFRGEARL